MYDRPMAIGATATVAVIMMSVGGCSRATLQGTSTRAQAGARIILDTDIRGDIDDVGAIAMRRALADRDEADILAIVSGNRNRWSVPAIDVINTY